jgi:hypothetical protein
MWLEGAAPGERTYTRASRRGNDRSDVVMPGRKRHSWMLNVILDTSASMSDEIPFALGAIADFCDVAGVDEVRLVQCDTVVTSDEMLSPSELADYQVSGYGGSDLTPALLALAEDPRVTRSAAPSTPLCWRTMGWSRVSARWTPSMMRAGLYPQSGPCRLAPHSVPATSRAICAVEPLECAPSINAEPLRGLSFS